MNDAREINEAFSGQKRTTERDGIRSMAVIHWAEKWKGHCLASLSIIKH